ncbi:family 43 glycosylhydrolase [Belliella marina]|uniref:Family 43 glycosylhydrolase n=1 Tax=Belliella marina TaxID=1644146 RepID=A0ABW4VLB2_9BACT
MNMIRIFLFFICFQTVFPVSAQYQTKVNKKGAAFYTNPIFGGDYPDPSILRDGDDYYIVHSSFEYYPGLLIWHSKDLVNWSPVTNALHQYLGSVWAPDLAKHNGKYYIYFPANNTNYVIWADSINGPWSEPIDLKIGHIDPGHAVDENGKRYLFFSSGGFVPLSDDGLSVSGEFKSSYQGWPIPREWSIECFCMEGPKLVKRGDYYYLTVAQGGTAGPATGHMIISARSKSLFGPWENAPHNPIVRTTDSSERWWSKGHGTIIDDPEGNWWMVYHAYENGYLNLGRQTLLLPVEWTEDGWYRVPKGIADTEPVKKEGLVTSDKNTTFSDNFEGANLKPQWKFFGGYDTNRYHLEDNSLVLEAKGNAIADCSPLLYTPTDHSYTAEVELLIEGEAKGGLVIFYNERAYSGILADHENILANIKGWQFETEKNVIENRVFLRLKNVNNTVDMYYSKDGDNWTKIQNSLEISGFHHNAFGGFLGVRIGLCSMGKGSVKFKNFVYKPINQK